ncbi:sulfiredoxin-1-like [Ornithodoros turicata]
MSEAAGLPEADASGKTILYLDFNSLVSAAAPGNPQNVVIVNSNLTNTYASSIHAGNITKVYDVPLEDIIRPIPISSFDEDRVRSLVELLENPNTKDQVAPVDLLWIKGRLGGNYYYAFGGNHRFEAHYRMGLSTIRAKLIRSTITDLQTYLGVHTPDLK